MLPIDFLKRDNCMFVQLNFHRMGEQMKLVISQMYGGSAIM